MGLIQHRAKPGLEGERAQAGQEILQLVLAVIAHEEICIGEAGPDDVLVAFGDQLSLRDGFTTREGWLATVMK